MGQHQYINFATAITAVLSCENILKVSEENIRSAIKNVSWPSRIEKVKSNFLEEILRNSESEIFIDGAHNVAGAYALARWIEEDKSKPCFVICGFSRGKCKKEFLEQFRGIAEIVAVRVDGEPYPEETEIIVKTANEANLEVLPCLDLLEAIYEISKKQNSQPCKIVICGSLHLARDLRKII